MKFYLKSKTVWFNIIMTFTEVALFLQDILPPEYMIYAFIVQGVGNIILRIWFTNTGLTLTRNNGDM